MNLSNIYFSFVFSWSIDDYVCNMNWQLCAARMHLFSLGSTLLSIN